MQIIIPMSGFGERFRRAGYQMPKPLIEIEGKTIIEHVVDLFPGEKDITFICNEDHLKTPSFRMEEILMRAAPSARIAAVTSRKLGPIDAVLRGVPDIDPDKPTIVNYCDFTCLWDWADFKSFAHETKCAGAIPCYRGFHPHSLGSTFYAYVRENGLWACDIQEKKPFTDEPKSEFASSGTYYFDSGRRMKEAFEETVRRELVVNGEYYVSMAYKPLFDRRDKVAVYEIAHFMQWGTPEDFEEYKRWSDLFHALCANAGDPPRLGGATLMPAAGLGARFSKEGFDKPKPLIDVAGTPMILRAINDLPRADATRVVLRRDLPMRDAVDAAIRTIPGADTMILDNMTDGQARTCLLGLDGLDESAPLTIGACDNGLLYDGARFAALAAEADVIVWGKRRHPAARLKPEHYGWIDADADGKIARVSVKVPLRDPATDPIVTGAFTFRRAGDFRRAAERMIERGGKVNGEYYVDECINDAIALGLDCRLFDVDHYLGWGTPDELRTFEYWTECFDKWKSHPYRLEADRRVKETARAAMRAAYRPMRPARPR
jgi:NDP-sugar pyrophosphorylase family protein